MDSDRFDRITKLFGTASTRRSTLCRLSALGMSSLAMLPADAPGKGKGRKKKKKKKTCKAGYKRCGIYCISEGLCCTDKDCSSCEMCESNGSCRPADLLAPLGSCADPCSDWKCTSEGFVCLPLTGCCSEDEGKLNCNACQEEECVDGIWQCVTKKPGEPCGPYCCEDGGCCHGGTTYRCCGAGPCCAEFEHCCNPGWTCDGNTCKPPA